MRPPSKEGCRVFQKSVRMRTNSTSSKFDEAKFQFFLQKFLTKLTKHNKKYAVRNLTVKTYEKNPIRNRICGSNPAFDASNAGADLPRGLW
jgi:hypothetical protein